MFEEALQSFRASLRERITSPLLGTFAVAWMLWNYRFVAVLFSDVPYTQKFDFIDKALYGGDFYQRILCQFVGPTASTAIFIFLYPVIAKSIFRYWRKKQQEIREIRLQIENQTLLTKAESFKLMQEMATLEADCQKQIADRDGQISRLKEALRACNEKTNDQASAESGSGSPSSPIQLSTPHEQLLKRLANTERRGQQVSQENLLANTPDRLESQSALDDLLRDNLVTRNYSQRDHTYIIALTPDGRKIALGLSDEPPPN